MNVLAWDIPKMTLCRSSGESPPDPHADFRREVKSIELRRALEPCPVWRCVGFHGAIFIYE